MKKTHTINSVNQILILNENESITELPHLIKRNIKAVRETYKESNYKLWNNNEIKKLIKENFHDEILYAYDTLIPFSYKADLAKFVILYLFGGLYIDLGVQAAQEWIIPIKKGIAACRDVSFTSPSWSAIQTGLLWAQPKRREFEIAIQYIVNNCKLRYYGENPLYPTGPVVLGRAFIAALAEKGQDPTADDQYVGSCRSVTPDSTMLNVSYVSKGGEVIAFRNKVIGGDLAHLGFSGSNNYNKIWDSRTIYGEKVRTWIADDCLIKTNYPVLKSPSGISAPKDYNGLLSYGPYTSLDAGFYNLRIHLRPNTHFRKICVNITSNFQNESIANFNITSKEVNNNVIDVYFYLGSFKEKVEFLIRTKSGFKGAIEKFELDPISRQKWLFSDFKIQTEIGSKKQNGISSHLLSKGRLVYGPYISLRKGHYKLLIKFSPGTCFTTAAIEIAAGKNHKTCQTLKLKMKNMKRGSIETTFTLDQDEENVEFRLWVSRFFIGKFISYEIFS
ncbi:glycosyltransferase [Zymomonas mobilis]|uniref:glycosyltransferase n=1 Tax=Zymomonas mobilis TaxID=542 RepID=UPI0039EB20B8